MPFKDNIRATLIPGRGNTLKYLQKAMFLGPLAMLINPNIIPDNSGLSTPIQKISNESEKLVLKIVYKLLKKYSKEALNYSDERIKEMIANRTEKEKVAIINDFDNMTDEEKAVELMKKRLGMGRWAVGGTKLIYAYDPEQYDRERAEREKAGIISFPGLGPYDTPNLEGRNVDDMGFVATDEGFEDDGYDHIQTGEDDA
jgi:hypothetical protein